MLQFFPPYSSAFPHSLYGHYSYLNGIDRKGQPYYITAWLPELFYGCEAGRVDARYLGKIARKLRGIIFW
jgi:hypothetical protein